MGHESGRAAAASIVKKRDAQIAVTWVRPDDPVGVFPLGLLVVQRLVEDPQHGQEVEGQQGVVDHVEHADLHCKNKGEEKG